MLLLMSANGEITMMSTTSSFPLQLKDRFRVNNSNSKERYHDRHLISSGSTDYFQAELFCGVFQTPLLHQISQFYTIFLRLLHFSYLTTRASVD